MTTETRFVTTDTWQEVTGVTSTSFTFLLQNIGGNTILLYRGETPNGGDAIKISKRGINNESTITINPQGEKIWAKSSFTSALSITELNAAEIINGASIFPLNVSSGKITGYDTIDKFGKNPLITTASDPEDVWEYGGLYTFTANTGTSYYFSSSNNGDTQNIKISVLTVDVSGNWNDETFTQTLVGQTKTLLTPPSGDPIVRIYRMENEGSVDIAGALYAYEDDTVVGGVPQTPSLVRAIINNGNNQTLMTIYTIPTGKVGFLLKGEAGMIFSGSVGTGTNAARITYKSRRIGQSFKVKKEFSLINLGSSNYIDVRSFPDPIPAKTDLKVTVEEVTADMGVWSTVDILLIDESQLTDEFLNSIGQIRRV